MAQSKVKIAIKFVLFVLLTILCVHAVNEWLKPEYYYTETWPTTNTYGDFYKLEKNSVDVLFLGSSHSVSALNPQIVYDNYGITSYNLGCEQQSLVITYYWIREALKYQSPKVIVLDTYMLHKYTDSYVYNDMNCSESAVRKPMDSMRFSPLKWEAGKVIEKIDPRQSGLSFSLLNIRYHTRWSYLGENDYTETQMLEHGGVKGFTAIGGRGDPDSLYVPFKDADAENVESEEMVETSRIYLDKIVQLCEEENIELVLVNIPCGESISRYRETKEYADLHGLPYYDFNEEVLYNEIGYNSAENLLSHPNYIGAEKISDYIGNLLLNEYSVKPREDPSYDESRTVYEHKVYNIELAPMYKTYQYLEKINNDNYSVFVFGPIAYSACINDELANKLFALGFTTDLRNVEDGTHYCAVRDPQNGVMEILTKDDLVKSGSIRGGLTTYKYSVNTTQMLQQNYVYSLVIDGTECGNQKVGLTVVVYDNDLKRIINKVNINTTVPELTMSGY